MLLDKKQQIMYWSFIWR